MGVYTDSFQIKTKGFCDVVDITLNVEEAIAKSRLTNGIALVFIAGSTAGLTTIEYESGAISDLKRTIEELVPQSREYQHNYRWRDGNGFSHIRSALIQTDLSVPFSGGKLLLGTWQQIVLLDFDNRSRNRKVIVQIIGE